MQLLWGGGTSRGTDNCGGCWWCCAIKGVRELIEASYEVALGFFLVHVIAEGQGRGCAGLLQVAWLAEAKVVFACS
jgi:hypothetical protein